MSTFNRLLLKLLASSTLFYLVLFITSPIAVQLSYAIVCDNVESDSSACDSSEVSSVTSPDFTFGRAVSDNTFVSYEWLLC
jgi:hypothetical protein